MNFDVYYKNKIFGNISTTEEDMFIIFDVNCEIISLDITKIYLKNNDFEIPLGILLPKKGRYILKKKLPKAYIKKIKLNESFTAFLKINGEYLINPDEIYDVNLKQCDFNSIIKTTFDDYDIYSFKYSNTSKFLFDFCFSFCKVNENYINLKTDKNGKIITK